MNTLKSKRSQLADVLRHPADIVELAGKLLGDAAANLLESQIVYEMAWFYYTGNKLMKCANNHRGQDICFIRWEQDEWEPEIPYTGIHPFGKLTWPNFSREPKVWECHTLNGPALSCTAEVHIDTEL